jgi:DNA processing protein
MKSFSIEALLGLFSIPTIGPTRMRKLIAVFGSPEAVLKAAFRQLTEVEGIDQKTAEKIKAGPDQQFVRSQLEMMQTHETQVITYWDEVFPQRLKKIFDPPALLFYKGNPECLNRPGLAIVGTRTPSGYGRMITEMFAKELTLQNLQIISGFARGVDTIAHKVTLKNGGSTIAVMGAGLDQIYPPENKSLFNEIPGNGVIISEYPMGVKPDAGNFPKRNRIISGLSHGVLITEAGEKSGALITALYAVDQDREVFAVPGAITNPKSKGVNTLIKKGAVLVQNVQDILDEISAQLGLSPNREPVVREDPQLAGNEKIIYDFLDDQPVHIDQLALKSDRSPAEALSALLMLELKGLIRQMAGKMFVRL